MIHGSCHDQVGNVSIENRPLDLLEQQDPQFGGHLGVSEPNQIEIRKSTDKDWLKILDLYNCLSQNDLEFRFMNLHHLTMDEARQISNMDTRTTYLALKGDAVIGEAALEEDGEISIVVSKGYRDEGIGVSLLTRLIEAARANGMKQVKFCCLPDNLQMAWLGAFLGFKLSKRFGMEDEWILNL
jgi:N-acetylglutamate synthase-like GNAT family acetyltransferase